MLKVLPLLLASSVSFAGVPSLQTSSDVPQEHKALLQTDLQRLSGKSVNITDPNFARVMDMSGPVNGDTMLAWLSDRVHYVVSGSFDFKTSYYVEQKNYNYQNPGVIPDIPKLVKQPDSGKPDASGKQVVTVMTNIGGGLYIAGKQSNILLGLNLPGIGKVPLSSPRVGVLQVGQGLFMVPKGENVQDIDNSLQRLATLFHEARHSDGNGKTLAMGHAICPEGHAFAGYAACDFSLNGSYSVGAQAGKVLTENCTECTAAQKESLRLNYVDSFSRVITEKKEDGGFNIDEATKATLKSTCDLLKKQSPGNIPAICQDINSPAAANAAVTKATYLDSRPEGTLEKHHGLFGF